MSENKLPAEVIGFIEEWKNKQGNLIMVLHKVQEHFGYIPCLNSDPTHISALTTIIDEQLTGWLGDDADEATKSRAITMGAPN